MKECARPFLDHSLWKTIKGIFATKGWATFGIQVLMEGYYFACAECQRVCPAGNLKQRRKLKEAGKVKPLK